MSVLPVLLLVILGISIAPTLGGISAEQKEALTAALSAGAEVAKLIEDKKFRDSLTKLAKNIGPYLGALGPVAGIFVAFIPVDDEVMQKLEQMMQNIDNRFDSVDQQFLNIERKIDFNQVKVNFGDIEQRIVTWSNKYEELYMRYNRPVVSSLRTNYVSHFPSGFQQAGLKLYNGIEERKGVFQENLVAAIMKYTKYHRKETQIFLLGLMRLLLQAVKVELSYYTLNNQATLYNHMKGIWEDRLKSVKSTFEKADNAVVAQYHSQLHADILDYAARNSGQSNQQFVSGLFRVLAAKYDWREWIVVAYNPISGGKNHWVQSCGGYIKFRQNGRNFIVSSVDRNARVMDTARAERDIKGIRLWKRTCGFWGRCSTKYYTSQELFNSLNRSGACSAGVVKCNENIWFHYHTRRFKYVNRCRETNGKYLFMWG